MLPRAIIGPRRILAELRESQAPTVKSRSRVRREPASSIVSLSGVDVDIAGTTVLHGIELAIRPGEHWGIVGGNGSGKSTLLALLAGQRWPAPGRGSRRYDFGNGSETDAVTARARITLLGHELQDLYTARGWNFRVQDIVLSGLTRTDIPQRRRSPTALAAADTLLARTGLTPLAERRLLELSRGEQRRVLICRALAFGPALLLLDEPASGLDADARAALDQLLAAVAATTPLVIAAHRAGELPASVNRRAWLDRGRLAAGAGAIERERQGESASGDASAAVRRAAAASIMVGQPVAAGSTAAGDRDPAVLIEVRRASVWLDGRPVLRDLDFTLREGEHWLVTGPNGAGKSSFLRLLNAELRPARGGRIRWPGLGEPRDVWTLRRRVALVSAELQARYRYPTTVFDAVASGCTASIGRVAPLTAARRARVEALLVAFELEALAGRLLTSLSYGQRHRALIARTLAASPKLLLLDEPWEGLDRDHCERIGRVLQQAMVEGTQVICVSHIGAGSLPLNRQLCLDSGRAASVGDSGGPSGSSASARRQAADCPPG
jgi:molybdate transport system ATP-binding protein